MSYPEKRAGKLTGHWYAQVDRRPHGGKLLRERFETKREAEGWEAYVKATGELPPWSSAGVGSGLTFAAVARECKDAGGKRGAWKRERDRSVVQRLEFLCDTALGRLPIEGVSTASLMALVADLEKRPGKRPGTKMAVGTINRYLTAASAMLSYAVAAGHRQDTPEIPWRKEAKQTRFWWLTEAQEKNVCGALVAAGHPTLATCVRILTRTGLRMGEFLTLEAGQVDVISEDEAWIRLWETKTDTPRSVPISPKLAGELRALVASKALPDYYTFEDQFKRACKTCEYSDRLTLHSLRHTTCTRLIQGRTPLPNVQRFMGHKSIQTTMRYSHVQDDNLAEAAKILYSHGGDEAKSADVVDLRIKQNQ